jgi:hypothetical protein
MNGVPGDAVEETHEHAAVIVMPPNETYYDYCSQTRSSSLTTRV